MKITITKNLIKTLHESHGLSDNYVFINKVKRKVMRDDGSSDENTFYEITNKVVKSIGPRKFVAHFDKQDDKGRFNKRNMQNHYPESLCLIEMTDRAKEFLKALND